MNKVLINKKNTYLTLSQEAIDALGVKGIMADKVIRSKSKKLLRHSKELIKVIEELGPESSDHYENLEIVEIKGNRYKIIKHEDCGCCYHPYEELITLDDSDWVEGPNGKRFKVISHESCGCCYDSWVDTIHPEDNDWIEIKECS